MRYFFITAFSCISIAAAISCESSTCEFKKIAINEYGFDEDSVDYIMDEAERVWRDRKWNTEYRNECFINYVLPPVAAKEPAEFYWRTDLPKRLNIEFADTVSIIEAALAINRGIDIITKNETWGNPQLSYSEIMSGKFGKCDDRSTIATLAMRAYGIPAAFEFIPSWGDTNNGHSFCSVILPNDSLRVFQERQDDGIHISYAHKVPKVYRKIFMGDKRTPLTEYIRNEDVPPEFSDMYIEDVTMFHNIGQCDIRIPTDTTRNKLAYLCVFSPKGWRPVAYGEIHNGEVIFKNVGNGGGYPFKQRGENLGDGILYLPIIFEEQQIKPIGRPFILSASGKREITGTIGFESILVTRKYPRMERIVGFAESMIGGVFEASNNPDFSDAVCIYKIQETPDSRVQCREVETNGKFYRYARYRKPNGTFSISEIAFFDANDTKIKGTPFIPTYIEPSDVKAIYDENSLTYYEIKSIKDFWTGIKFCNPSQIKKISFCPRTDDNDVSPGDEYELLFWNDNSEWESLGKKTAGDYFLIFDNVPMGALLWLKNLSKGKEERPFTYENGKQIWW